MYPQLPPVIGAPQVCCGHASGIYFPRLLWFGGCATRVTPCSVPGYSYFIMCLEKYEHNCLIRYWYTAAILASFFLFACLRRCFSLNLSNRNKKQQRYPAKNTPLGQQTSYCVYCSLKPTAVHTAYTRAKTKHCDGLTWGAKAPDGPAFSSLAVPTRDVLYGCLTSDPKARVASRQT